MYKIVRVDMSTKKVTYENKEEYKLLGGRALTSRITYDEVEPNCEPLGFKNKVIIAPVCLQARSHLAPAEYLLAVKVLNKRYKRSKLRGHIRP